MVAFGWRKNTAQLANNNKIIFMLKLIRSPSHSTSHRSCDSLNSKKTSVLGRMIMRMGLMKATKATTEVAQTPAYLLNVNCHEDVSPSGPNESAAPLLLLLLLLFWCSKSHRPYAPSGGGYAKSDSPVTAVVLSPQSGSYKIKQCELFECRFFPAAGEKTVYDEMKESLFYCADFRKELSPFIADCENFSLGRFGLK